MDATSVELEADYKTVLDELYKYDVKLVNKPRITVLNKIDAIQKEVLQRKLKILNKYESQVYAISAVTCLGINQVLQEASRQIKLEASESDKHIETEKLWHPTDH